MNAAIELHDSVVEAIDEADGAVTLRMSAYVHRSTGLPGYDAGTGWKQQIELVFAGGLIVQRPGELSCTLNDGRVTGGIELDGMIPLPVAVPTAVRFDARGLYRDQVVVSGTRLDVRATNEGVYIESFPGS